MKKINDDVIKQLLNSVDNPQDLFGSGGLMQQLTKRLVETALEQEMEAHLGYKKNDPKGNNSGNSRNGYSQKKILNENGQSVELDVPRDRNGEFEPQMVKKGQRRLPGFDEKVISLYSRGMSTREIQGHLSEVYGGAEINPMLISRVTDAVKEDVKDWRERPLDAIYPIVYLDAMVLKIRQDGPLRNKALYLAIGVNLRGDREVLGMWLEQTEGAKFWLSVMTDLQNRGVQDIFVACVDGLKGFPEAIESVFPKTVVQSCVVHMIRNSLKLVGWKNRKKLATALRPIYTAINEEAGLAALEHFEQTWGKEYPMIVQTWERNWDRICPFFNFSKEIRKAIYTTNTIESLNSQIRKAVKVKGGFPTDDAALKVCYLAIQKASKNWSRSIQNWDLALQQFAIHFEGRLTMNDINNSRLAD
mgnify:CR=1 FL=1